MDMKALAKSKRAHSNHHNKKHHPHQAPKAPSVASDGKRPTGKQAKGKPPQSYVTEPLPSNWERYNENSDSISEEARPSSSRPTEFVMRTSKGADYALLISEAKDQLRSDYSSDVFPSLDDVINDFTQDFAPMLLVAKGQSMLSWVYDDDFEFEGKTSTTIEAPFLSLNLDALAEQLAKAKLSERCFLDPDVFPPELMDDELKPRDEDKHDPQTLTPAGESDSRTASISHNKEFIKNVRQYPESSSYSVTATSNPLKQEGVEIMQSQGTVRSTSPKFISDCTIDSTARNPPIFRGASAEAELDMLLSSFSETKINESTSASSSPMEIPSTTVVSGETAKNRMHVMKPADLDDDIDKLLEETSGLTNIDGGGVSNEVRAIPDVISSSLIPGSKSKFLDDFDSWLDTI